MSMYKSKLEEWGLEEFIPGFEGEGIDDDTFWLLDEETIRLIFAKSGPRLKFKKHYLSYKHGPIEKTGPDPDAECASEVTDTNSANSDAASNATASSIITIPNSYELDLDTSYLYEPDVETCKGIESIQCFEDTTPQFLKPRSPKSKAEEDIALADDQFPKKQKLRTVFSLDLETILKKYTDGQIALANKAKLTNDCRQKIVKVIINELIASFGSEIRASTFLKLSEEIEQLFPNEKADTYYIPYCPGGKNKRGFGPKGKLWSRYVNVRSALRSANTIKGVKAVDKETGKSSPEQTTTSVEAGHLDFLKVATEPYARVLEAWEETFKLRRRLYLNSDLESIFSDFPCLKLNTGIQLIETDFNNRFGEQIDTIYSTWPKISAAILKEVKERNINIGTSVFKDASLNALMTLPYLFSPVTIKKARKGDNWRPTRSEVQESFFLHISSYDELTERFSARKKKLNEYGISLQPTGCVVGSLEDPDGYYIIVDDVKYKVESSIRALELLYKLFHALDLDYPVESEAIWLFIQELVFDMKVAKKLPSTVAVISDIKYHMQNTQ